MENRSVQPKQYDSKNLLLGLKDFKHLIQLISLVLSACPFTKKLSKLRKVVEGAKKPDPVKLTTTSSGEAEKSKTQYSDDDTVWLIYHLCKDISRSRV